MRSLIVFALLVLVAAVSYSQSNALAQEHALLVKDCKLIKGHAGRVVAEASEPELNRDVALAHAEQIAKSLKDMEWHLEQAQKLLKPDQLKLVKQHHELLAKSCETLKKNSESLEKELNKSNPDRLTVKKLATALRQEMTTASGYHDALRAKLGIK
ncbi:MAG: hypothetical protein FJ215_05600 [Ignavibacteria bacterium]|nr:hypothetical protein [Ignavibacteria bacterium]